MKLEASIFLKRKICSQAQTPQTLVLFGIVGETAVSTLN